ncbi:MAG TPA: 50S ribosomal protein L6 [Polyangiaceae bacterium]|jgi:large subunit ribosomal protein L6|nr:50S ribosomal protein L6 [Polyangiaceae bacterium]
MAAPQVETKGKRESRIGKRSIALPKGVTVAVKDRKVEVKGQKGTLSMELPPTVSVSETNGQLAVASADEGPDGPRLQGLGRALLANLVRGVSAGYEQVLELVGTGYRAEVKGNVVHLALGFSHPVAYELPKSVTGKIAPDSKGAVLHLESPDKAALGQAAATIRGFRPPEPYGGKGVRYRGENILRKAGKAGKK